MKIAIHLITLFGVGPFGSDVSFTDLCYGGVCDRMLKWLRRNWQHFSLEKVAPFKCPDDLTMPLAMKYLREAGVRSYIKCVLYEGPGNYEDADPDRNTVSPA